MLEQRDVFNAAFRGEYARAMQAQMPADLAPIMNLAQTLRATGAYESQTWMSPVPDPSEIVDSRIPFGLLDVTAQNVRMKEFGSGFRVKAADLEDDQLGLYLGKPGELVSRTKRGVTTTLLDTVIAARSILSFEGDGTYQAADTHTVGTGDNLRSLTTADKTSETMAFMYIGGPIKPLIWYARSETGLLTDINSPEANARGYYRWWNKYRGAAAFGFWWDFVFVDADGIPTIAEFQTMLGEVTAAFRSFKLPDGGYIHEQTKFNSGNLVALVSPAVENVARQVSEQSLVVIGGTPTENPYKGMFSYLIANGMDQA